MQGESGVILKEHNFHVSYRQVYAKIKQSIVVPEVVSAVSKSMFCVAARVISFELAYL